MRVKRIGEPRDDLVLHVEEIGERLVEPLGPEVMTRFSVYELDIDAHAVAAALDAAVENIADVQLAPDRLHVECITECPSTSPSRLIRRSNSNVALEVWLVLHRDLRSTQWVRLMFDWLAGGPSEYVKGRIGPAPE